MNKYEALKYFFNYDSFRPFQESIIDALLAKVDVISVIPTGGGKSICFQIPGLIIEGISIIISPLISLMYDQVQKLKQANIKACFISSDQNYQELKKIYREIENNEIKFIYVSPERLLNERFISIVKDKEVSYLIVDEAHCITIWGNDFRISYKQINLFINKLKNRPVISAFTATANDLSIKEIVSCLSMINPKIIKGNFDRGNLFYIIKRPKDKFGMLLKYLLKYKNDSGIIYALTRKECDYIYLKLSSLGFDVLKYHGKMESFEKEKTQKEFVSKNSIVVATNAFGMGIDKPNIRFVINYQIPLTIEDLVQQQGRCGRDNQYGECILFFDPKDISVCEYFINQIEVTNIKTYKKIKLEKYKQLKEVIKYATYDGCLHQFINNYFGFKSEKCKDMCSNCKKKSNLFISPIY